MFTGGESKSNCSQISHKLPFNQQKELFTLYDQRQTLEEVNNGTDISGD